MPRASQPDTIKLGVGAGRPQRFGPNRRGLIEVSCRLIEILTGPILVLAARLVSSLDIPVIVHREPDLAGSPRDSDTGGLVGTRRFESARYAWAAASCNVRYTYTTTRA